jgi:hypothetical protein
MSPGKSFENRGFRPKMTVLEKWLFIDAFHMSPHSRWFLGLPENGQKWGKIGFLDFLIIF